MAPHLFSPLRGLDKLHDHRRPATAAVALRGHIGLVGRFADRPRPAVPMPAQFVPVPPQARTGLRGLAVLKGRHGPATTAVALKRHLGMLARFAARPGAAVPVPAAGPAPRKLRGLAVLKGRHGPATAAVALKRHLGMLARFAARPTMADPRPTMADPRPAPAPAAAPSTGVRGLAKLRRDHHLPAITSTALKRRLGLLARFAARPVPPNPVAQHGAERWPRGLRGLAQLRRLKRGLAATAQAATHPNGPPHRPFPKRSATQPRQ